MAGLRRLLTLLRSPAARADRRERHRLRQHPNRNPGESSITGTPLRFTDGRSFLDQYIALFEKERLRFPSENPAPRIIDGGANIGMATLYFKRLHPNARITAFEADPDIHAIATENIHQRAGHRDVEVRQEALWAEETELDFGSEGAESGRAVHINPERFSPRRVPAVPLAPWLREPVDFLKLDIEGAELPVLRVCASELRNVRHIFVEYHSFVGEEQTLAELLALLRDAGFRVQVRTAYSAEQPFHQRYDYLGMDLLLEIFGWRGESR